MSGAHAPPTMVEALATVEVRRWIDPHGVASDTVVARVDHDSRAVERGSLFCCIPGARSDGHDHAPAAVARGAVGLLAERPVDLGPAQAVPQALVRSVRRAIGPVSASVAGDPSLDMAVVGVTGTNGKTTVTHLLQSVLRHAGRACEVIGTLSGARTTPEAPELQRTLAAQRRAGAEVVAMEVSSHALDMHRVDGTRFAVAAFTNLSRDHLDHHGTMERYFEAKARLFTPELARAAVVDLDDRWGRRLAERTSLPLVGYRLADAEGLEVGVAGATFRWRGQPVALHLGGRFNVSNALAAAEVALLLGVDAATVAAGLSAPLSVPGRFERVDAGQDFDVVVDYAHTPDGLAHLLEAAGEGARSARVIVVFGCGGDRDRSKRAPMGAVAARRADVVVVTADNSRSEPTEDIVAEVLGGAESVEDRRAQQLDVVLDRREAIAAALGAARPGDVVVIAGKGHETTQTIGDVVVDLDDRDVARELLAGGAA